MTKEEAIKRWKELGIITCVMVFNCGGDSMGDTDFIFHTKKTKISDEMLEEYFENEVYNNVEFYVNSDGHYMGESGTVEITLDEDDDEPFFDYSKSAQSEWNEQTRNVLSIKLTPEMIDFINKNVSNINGSQDRLTINYKRDFILSDADEKIHDELETLIQTETEEYQPGDVSSVDDWHTFTTADDEDDETDSLVIKDGMLLVNITNSYTEYRDSED